jgi:hypothetical protein
METGSIFLTPGWRNPSSKRFVICFHNLLFLLNTNINTNTGISPFLGRILGS